jgi:hypothetical protein
MYLPFWLYPYFDIGTPSRARANFFSLDSKGQLTSQWPQIPLRSRGICMAKLAVKLRSCPSY